MAEYEMTPIHQLTREEVIERWREYPRSSLISIYGVMKGATLANAAFVLTEPEFTQHPTRWMFWLVSFVGLMATYSASSVGTILTPPELRLANTILPFSLAIAEFAMFATLAGYPHADPGAPQAWYVAFALWAALGSGVIWAVRILLFTDDNFVESLHPLVARHRRTLYTDGILAAVVALAASGLAATYALWHDIPAWGHQLLAVTLCLSVAAAIANQERERMRIAEYLGVADAHRQLARR